MNFEPVVISRADMNYKAVNVFTGLLPRMDVSSSLMMIGHYRSLCIRSPSHIWLIQRQTPILNQKMTKCFRNCQPAKKKVKVSSIAKTQTIETQRAECLRAWLGVAVSQTRTQFKPNKNGVLVWQASTDGLLQNVLPTKLGVRFFITLIVQSWMEIVWVSGCKAPCAETKTILTSLKTLFCE